MMDDWSLLQQYVHEGSKEALDELVRRYLPLVYAAALRQVGDCDLAEDITQVVFLVLMRRAAHISRNVSLGGWLFNVTKFSAAKLRRSDWRRQHHERKAATMRPTIAESTSPNTGHGSLGLLDAAIAELSRTDRDAVVMRYIQGKGIGEIAQAQHVSERTARQRLFRALIKLRTRLRKKGLRNSQAVLGASLGALECHAPPAAVATRVLTTLHSSAAANVWSPAVVMVLRVMIVTKIKSVAVASTALIFLFSVGGGIVYFATFNHNSREAVPPISQLAASPSASAQNAANTPNATLIALLGAVGSGDANVLVASFEPLSVAQETTLRQAARGMAAASKLRTAVATKFGDQAATRLFQQLNIDPSPEIVAAMTDTSPTYEEATSAQMEVPKIGQIKFVKVGEMWKVRSEMLRSNLAFFSQFASALPVLTNLTSEVNADRFRDLREMRLAMETRVGKDPAGDPPDRPAVLGPGTTPRETIAALAWAQTTGDEEAAIACFASPSTDELAGLRVQTELFSAGEQIRSAIAAKFGLTVARNSVLALGLDSGLSKQMLNSTGDVADTSTADRVQVDLAPIGLNMSLIRSGGLWRIEPASVGLWKQTPKWGTRLHEHFLPKYLSNWLLT